MPQLGSMIYTMNGMTTQLNLQADAPGTFHGLKGWLPYLWREWITSVDHKRIGVMYCCWRW
jgi:hypothetical protein